jgi:hypothetical protein
MKSMLLPTSAGTINLVIAPHAGIILVDEVVARLSLNSPVRLIDCGNRANAFPIAKVIRTLTTNINTALENIQISRAFTCYQVSSMLHQEPNAQGLPILVVDLLSTFLDEDVSLIESRRLLAQSIIDLHRLSQTSPALITIKPLLTVSTDRLPLLNALVDIAATTFRLEEPSPLPTPDVQATLWPI